MIDPPILVGGKPKEANKKKVIILQPGLGAKVPLVPSWSKNAP